MTASVTEFMEEKRSKTVRLPSVAKVLVFVEAKVSSVKDGESGGRAFADPLEWRLWRWSRLLGGP